MVMKKMILIGVGGFKNAPHKHLKRHIQEFANDYLPLI